MFLIKLNRRILANLRYTVLFQNTKIISMVSACLIARKYLLSNKNQEYFARFHRNGLITDIT